MEGSHLLAFPASLADAQERAHEFCRAQPAAVGPFARAGAIRSARLPAEFASQVGVLGCLPRGLEGRVHAWLGGLGGCPRPNVASLRGRPTKQAPWPSLPASRTHPACMHAPTHPPTNQPTHSCPIQGYAWRTLDPDSWRVCEGPRCLAFAIIECASKGSRPLAPDEDGNLGCGNLGKNVSADCCIVVSVLEGGRKQKVYV